MKSRRSEFSIETLPGWWSSIVSVVPPSSAHYNHDKTTLKCTIMFLMDFIKIFIVAQIGRHAVLIPLCTKDKTSLFVKIQLN